MKFGRIRLNEGEILSFGLAQARFVTILAMVCVFSGLTVENLD